ncbi:S-layer homology domain-containing protein [Chungangia koreensis]|uniref:S-layer homology domain-containing protein n=1 Tax=Chungangia koreensis TaxID=752657 RepID=A0ABV8X2D8_9LACT
MRKIAIVVVSMFMLIGFGGQASAETGFSDVKPGDPFEKEMMYLYEKGIIKGYEDGRFGPEDNVTRGAAALMIARAIGLDTEKTKTEFKDVPSDIEASGAIQSANDRGILQGYGNGIFKPNKVVNRGEMAIFIARAFNLQDEEVIAFKDVSIKQVSYSSIRRILAAGITNGYNGGIFKSNTELTRREFSAFLARALNADFRVDVNTCGYDPASKTNPDRQTVNCLLTREALKQGVPPEIVKGIASAENGPWKQFNADGTPFKSTDGGIGVMQITLTDGYNVERLENDLTYNIEVGVEMLKKNFGRSVLPTVGSKSPNSLESWYFAVMAYNGVVGLNSPIVKETGLRNPGAYQEKVYAQIAENGLKSTKIANIEMSSSDFTYGPETNWVIKFNKTHFPLKGNTETASAERFVAGDDVRSTVEGRLRPTPTVGLSYTSVSTTNDIHIVGGPVYDENKNSTNAFVWYPAMVEKNGKKIYGYIASFNLVKK